MKNNWNNVKAVITARNSLDGALTSTEYNIYCYIQHSEPTNITRITKSPYFKDVSLSTVKRAVLTLLNNELIIARQSKSDRRVNYLESTAQSPTTTTTE